VNSLKKQQEKFTKYTQEIISNINELITYIHNVKMRKNKNIYFTLFYIMIKYSTIKELRFLREDMYIIYYVGSSVGSFFVVVFLRVTLCSVLVLRSLCFFLFFLPSVIYTFFLSRVVLILLKYFVML